MGTMEWRVIGEGPVAEERRIELERQGFRVTRTMQDLWEAAKEQMDKAIAEAAGHR